MNYFKLGNSNINASSVSLGLMRISDKSQDEAVKIIKTALDNGINFFDHADIYGDGNSEIVFAKAMKEINIPRDSYYLQSKVGIRKKIAYDFDKDYILKSVDGILERLDTNYIDVLLLHRPDMLWVPEEVALAFNELKKSGKVKYFGVSNMNQFQISYLQSKLDFPLIVNQLQFSIMHAELVSTSIYVNTNFQTSNVNGLLDYLREKNITVQAWSPFQYGRFEGVFIDNEKFPELNKVLERLADKYNVSKIAISVAWIKRHPANIQTIIGTMTPSRIVESCKGSEIHLTKEEWYEIFIAAGNWII